MTSNQLFKNPHKTQAAVPKVASLDLICNMHPHRQGQWRSDLEMHGTWIASWSALSGTEPAKLSLT
jgi:hypothetical protein